MSKACFQCKKTNTTNLYGYDICDSCKSDLKLFTGATIKKHTKRFQESETISYKQSIKNRLEEVEIKYAKAKIKLLDIQEKLNRL
jgi:hypothetical protein